MVRLATAVLVGLLVGCSPDHEDSSATAAQPIPATAVAAIQTELDRWASGRWDSVFVAADSTHLSIEVGIWSGANDIARRNYCKIIREAASSRLSPNQTWEARLLVNGQPVQSCT